MKAAERASLKALRSHQQRLKALAVGQCRYLQTVLDEALGLALLLLESNERKRGNDLIVHIRCFNSKNPAHKPAGNVAEELKILNNQSFRIYIIPTNADLLKILDGDRSINFSSSECLPQRTTARNGNSNSNSNSNSSLGSERR